MTRIPLVTAENLSPSQRPVYDAIVSACNRGGRLPAPYQLSLHCPEFTDKWQQMGELLRYRTGLPRHINELAILITARHWSCDYEWYAHAPAALAAGLSPKIVEAIRVGQEPEFEAPGERAIYNFCSQLLRTHFVDEATHAAVREAFGVTGAIEVVAVVGYYVMVAMALNGHAYPLPAGAQDLLPKSPDKAV
jgi:4-carboxymuconolactone decarboxylase